jgi:hypothetical protein
LSPVGSSIGSGAQQVARVGVHQREHVAPVAVLHAELAFEIDAPGVVGLPRLRKWLRQRWRPLPLLLQSAEAASLENVADRSGARPLDLRVAFEHDRAQFPRPPARHQLARLDDEILDLG